MSSGVSVGTFVLRKALGDISPLFPSGTHTVPVLFQLRGNALLMACTTGCLYINTLSVSNTDNESWEATVVYKNLLDFLPKDGSVTITHAPFGLNFRGEGCSIDLPVGYSIITPPEIPNGDYADVTSNGYVSGLRYLIGMNLGTLYAADKPINLYGDIAVLKYPNIQIQVRTPGLGLFATLAVEHVRLLMRFEPEEWYTNNVDMLVLKRKQAYLELPMEPISEENKFVELLAGMSDPITLDFEHYLDKLRSMQKTSARGRCKLVLRESGLTTSVSHENITISTTMGDEESKVVSTLYMPMDLWLAMVRAAGSGKAQVLFREDVLCLRTQAIIIVVRALV